MLSSEEKKLINETLENGGVIAFETDTVWGIGCLPEKKDAITKIYNLKNRDTSKPLILMSSEAKNLFPYVKTVPQTAKKLIEKHFPGALTIVLEKSEITPNSITAGKNTVGIRVPNHIQFKNLCEAINGKVLATTSANRSSEPPCKTYEEIRAKLGQNLGYILKNKGTNTSDSASTVVLITESSIKVLRQGSINISE